MADHQHAGAARGQLGEQGHNLRRQGRVEVAGRLISHQQFGLADDGAGDADALLLAGRQLRGQRLLAMAQAHPFEHRAHALADVAAAAGDGPGRPPPPRVGGAAHRRHAPSAGCARRTPPRHGWAARRGGST
ncbi:hypothetical protein G6F58_013104 [Rhizopus delemar]|nr:hypothetical protein G6F58_013104 [Rhizopus delemar]